MEKEENVYVETEGTEQVAVCQGDGKEENVRAESSAVPEKFKDVDALARAYGSLQAEFTRRSQRLKELERKLENLEGENAQGRSGAEKLRKNAQARKAETARFESFVAETERAGAQETQEKEPEEPTASEPSKEETLKGEKTENGDTVYATKPLTDKPAQGGEYVMKQAQENVADVVGEEKQAIRGEEPQVSVAGKEHAEIPSETLYAQVCRDEGVRLRIIGEYLSSLGKSSVPLMTGGAGTFTSPPRKAANIAEAGDMALLYLKKPSNR